MVKTKANVYIETAGATNSLSALSLFTKIVWSNFISSFVQWLPTTDLLWLKAFLIYYYDILELNHYLKVKDRVLSLV